MYTSKVSVPMLIERVPVFFAKRCLWLINILEFAFTRVMLTDLGEDLVMSHEERTLNQLFLVGFLIPEINWVKFLKKELFTNKNIVIY